MSQATADLFLAVPLAVVVTAAALVVLDKAVKRVRRPAREAYTLPIARPPAVAVARSSAIRAQADFANDGEELDVNWDEEAKKLGDLAKPMNQYYKELSSLEMTELVKEFAKTAPAEVQFAVKTTVASLLGQMPPAVGETSITTTGKNLATLMFNMQMTGYMFRNAEYRKSLVKSMDKSLGSGQASLTLPPVSGKINVNIAGMKAEVDAAAYMAELRSEVEGLRAQLATTGTSDEESEVALIAYIQALDKEKQQELTRDVGADILEAMSQLVATILIDLNIDREQETAAPLDKMRELLIWQLVSGYKLREMEVKEELKDKFWGADADKDK